MQVAPMNLWKKYETDPVKENQGIATEFEGVTFYLRRAGGGNRAYRYVLGMEAQKFSHLWKQEPRDDLAIWNANEEMQQIAFAKTILFDWTGMVDRKGEPLEFSEEAALDLIQSCPAIWDHLKGVAIDDERFRPDEDGEQLGKLSYGGESGATASTD